MRVVSKMTGLPADTIRIWERRYAVVKPFRTEGNARRYSGTQVQRLSLLKAATEAGHSIGDVSKLDEDGLRSLLAQRQGSEQTHERIVSDYVQHVMNFEIYEAEQVLSRTASFVPSLELTMDVVLPILGKLSDEAKAGRLTKAHERVAASQLRCLLGGLFREVAPPKGALTLLTGTPAGHTREFAALGVGFLAASRGFRAIHLGPDLPAQDCVAAANCIRPDVFVLGISDSALEGSELAQFENDFGAGSTKAIWILSDKGAETQPTNARLFASFEALDQALLELSVGPQAIAAAAEEHSAQPAPV